MNAFKKYLHLVIAFGLGSLITYLAVHLSIANKKLEEKIMHSAKPIPEKEEKTWFEEKEEKQSADIEKRTRELQSMGDNLKSQFDQFSDE